MITSSTSVPRLVSDRRVPGIDRPIPAIGAGCWTIGGPTANGPVPIGWDGVDPTAAFDGLIHAYELGARLFDTADVYGLGRSELLLGRLLAQVPRDDVIVSSKVGYFTGSAAHPYVPEQIRTQCQRSLEHLGTDHLDVYFLHSANFGPRDVYLGAAVEVFADLRRQGIIRAVGMRAPHDFAVEWAGRDLGDASRQASRFLHLFAAIQPDVLTVRHNLLSYEYCDAETDIFAFARRHNVGVLIKQALGQGILLGTHHPERPRTFSAGDHRSIDPTFRHTVLRRVTASLAAATQAIGDQPAILLRAAIGYALHRAPDTSVLVGFRDATQFHATIEAANRPLTRTEVDLVHLALKPVRSMLHTDLFHTAHVHNPNQQLSSPSEGTS